MIIKDKKWMGGCILLKFLKFVIVSECCFGHFQVIAFGPATLGNLSGRLRKNKRPVKW